MPPTSPTKPVPDINIPGLHTRSDITLDVGPGVTDGRPLPIKHMSTPAYDSPISHHGYQSPLRHHHRAASSTRKVKETLNAHSEYSNSEDDGTAQHRINQYLIQQEIGRGSFGAVHLASDQYNQEYAIKEFSKSRLRKRAQSNLLRRPSARARRQGARTALGFNSPLHRHSSDDGESNNSLDLIKEEIAIMKKLNHPNVVSLIEVLDDPEEDSLYMVMEMCKKGVVMQVGLEERADPYDDEQCRCWFRDMILGIEYLHAQGIIHRDLKPDNCLITEDDVLKIVDFGVSEMFEKDAEMRTAKSAGSPAFMPPELCVARHGQISGKAADIWSMGVTLYCLKFGRIPFEKTGMLELYDAIRGDELEFESKCDEGLKDLLHKLLDKNPERRITMEKIRVHPWVTKGGTDELLPTEENVAVIVEPPTEEEMNAAITGNMGHLITVVRAVKRFKQLLFRRRPELMEGILGSASRIVQPPLSMRPHRMRKTKSSDIADRPPLERVLTAEGIHHDIRITDEDIADLESALPPEAVHGVRSGIEKTLRGLAAYAPTSAPATAPAPASEPPGTKVVHENMSSRPSQPAPIPISHPAHSSAGSTPRPGSALGKGHAHDPLQDTLFLHIGTGSDPNSTNPDPTNTSMDPDTKTPIVSESPSNVDMNVYEAAYQEEVQRIMKNKEESDRRPTLYLTRRVESVKSIRENECIFDGSRLGNLASDPKASFAKLVDKARKAGDSAGMTQSQDDAVKPPPTPEKESLMRRGLDKVRDVRDAVNEAREEVRAEERS